MELSNRGRLPWRAPADMGAGSPLRNQNAVSSTSPGSPDASPVTASHWYASIISIQDDVLVFGSGNTSDALILERPANSWRNFLCIRNPNAAIDLVIGFGRAPNAQDWCALAPGAILLFDTVVPQDDLYALATGAGARISIGYSTTTR